MDAARAAVHARCGDHGKWEDDDGAECWHESDDDGCGGYAIERMDEEVVAEGDEYVEIDPDHSSLICAAVRDAGRHMDDCCGDDPDDHDWTSEGEGGCRENPGVWSHGGTTMIFSSHCRKCGLHRTETSLGSQRNPGEHDTTEYSMPSHWCARCAGEECLCEQEEGAA
jgi:hypothetical protein